MEPRPPPLSATAVFGECSAPREESRASDGPRYERRGELGRGGMGVVWLAHDRVVGRLVALKTLEQDAPSPAVRARFAREGRITGRLEHPGIPAVHDLGVDERGRPYIAMKVVRGASLRDRIERAADAARRRRRAAAWPIRERLDALLKVTDALSFAHSHGVIHRDLKPENVMIGEFGEVQVMDWGLARLVGAAAAAEGASAAVDESDGGADALRTRDGAIAGTPAYMSPEQAKGDIAALDPRTDVFALGALLYELLTLRPPYTDGTVLTILARAGEADWTPVQERVARADPPVDRPAPELVAIAHTAMARDPAARYPSAAAFAADVRAFLAHDPVSVHRDSFGARAMKRVQRHPRAAVALGVALVVVALSAQVRAANRAANAQRLAAELSRAQAELATGARQRAEEERGRLAAHAAELSRLATEQLDASSREAITRFRAVVREARARGLSDGELYRSFEASDLDSWLRAYDALERVHSLVGSAPPASFHFERGMVRRARGDIDGARSDYARALELEPSHVAAWIHQGSLRRDQGDTEGALADYARAIALNPTLVHPWLRSGDVRRSAGDYAAAIADYSRAIELDPRCVAAWNNRGYARRSAGDADGALVDFERTLAIDPGHAEARFNRASLRAFRGDHEGAIDDYSRALESSPRDDVALLQRALSRVSLGDRAAALRDLDLAITLRPDSADARRARARVRRQTGDFAGAIADHDAMLDATPDDPVTLAGRAETYLVQGDRRRAAEDLDRALTIDPRCVAALVGRGILRSANGDALSAIADFDLAIALDPRSGLALTNRGLVRMAQGDTAGAIEDHTRAAELDSTLVAAPYNRALARAAQGDVDGAIADYTRALEIDPRYAEALTNRGIGRKARGDLDGAIDDYRRALASKPELWQAAMNLGVAVGERGDTTGALEAFRTALRHCPVPAARGRIEGHIARLLASGSGR